MSLTGVGVRLRARLDGYESMQPLGQIQSEIESLGASDYRALRRWFVERDWEAWDRDLEEDATSGKLDFLADEADVAKGTSRLRTL